MKLSELLPRLPGIVLEGIVLEGIDPDGIDPDGIDPDGIDPDGIAAIESAALEVCGITLRSQQIEPGQIFAALPGQRHHGLEFLDQALARGAAAVLTDQPRPAGVTITWLRSEQPRRHTALAAWALAGEPQRQLQLIGITGTNGKSTVADLVYQILVAAGIPAGCLGTLSYRLVNETVTASRTTPEATDLARYLRRLANQGGRAAVMEVSSHALIQQRVAGLEYAVAVWTNLTREHLDFHHDMEHYFAAKSELFTDAYLPSGRRVLPVDDPWASRLLQVPRAGDVSWGKHHGAVHASKIRHSLDGTTFQLHLPEQTLEVELQLVGAHNLENALAAAAAAHAAGLDPAAISAGLAAARPLAGRMQRVQVDRPFPVFVDYAHTPDGFRSVLTTLRQLSDRRIVVVFGAGGERDHGKREPMARVVGELADLVVITSDNPRSEDPAAIAATLADGVRDAGTQPEIVLDRREAIARALELAEHDCLLLLAGKGHEQSQTIGDQVLPFSDRDTVIELAGGGSCS